MAELSIQFLDVGQGDGIYIVFPNDVTMLVDLGSTKNKRTTGPDVLEYFKNHTRFGKPGALLNYLIVTHPDSDHYNMVNTFLTTLKPKVQWYTYGGSFRDYSSTSWMNNVEGAGAKFFAFSSLPTELKRPGGFGDGVVVRCLACDTVPTMKKSDRAWIKNTSSVVLQIVYNKISIMLTGDSTFDTEWKILARFKEDDLDIADLRSNVLKVAHHGSSRTSSCREWIAAVNPEAVFISSDRSGSLDEDQKPTGHRLPQELTLDIIRKHATRLAKSYVQHSYISSYDPKDYKNYNETIDSTLKATLLSQMPLSKKKGVQVRRWIEVSTKEAIFTTLTKIGLASAEADQGCQYELTVSPGGKIGVLSTEEFKDVEMSF